MALNKVITNEVGVTTTYHKIDEINMRKILATEINAETEETYTIEKVNVTVSIFSYVTKEIRDLSIRNAASRRKLFFDCSLDDIKNKPIYTVLYDKIKELKPFKDATDC